MNRYFLDQTCIVWGKTCSGTGNCWLYDVESLRYIMNLTAASFVTIGVLFDVGVWYFVKNLKIYDEPEDDDQEMNSLKTQKADGAAANLFQSNLSIQSHIKNST